MYYFSDHSDLSSSIAYPGSSLTYSWVLKGKDGVNMQHLLIELWYLELFSIANDFKFSNLNIND